MGRLDTNIPMQVRSFDISGLADGYLAGRQVKRQRELDALNKEDVLADRKAREKRLGFDINQETRTQKTFDEQTTTIAEQRKDKRRQLLTKLHADEAETLFSLPEEKRPVYYKEHLLPSLKEEGFDVSDMPEYSNELIQSWRTQALSPDERSRIRIEEEKNKGTQAKDLKYQEWRKSVEPFLKTRGYKLKQADVNRVMATYPAELSGYAPAEKFVDNLKVEPPPAIGTTYTPHQKVIDVISTRKDFDDNLEIKALKLAYQKSQQINVLHGQYLQAKRSGKELSPQFSDQVFAVNFNKMIDEMSAVMPGEFARTAQGAGLTESLKALALQAADGGLKFTDDQRNEIVRVTNELMKVTKERARPVYDQFVQEAGYLGVPEQRIVGSTSQYFREVPKRLVRPQPKPGITPPAAGKTSTGLEFRIVPKGTQGETKSGLKYSIEEMP